MINLTRLFNYLALINKSNNKTGSSSKKPSIKIKQLDGWIWKFS